MADELVLHVRADGAGEVTVEVSGEIDMSNVPGLEAFLREHTDADLTVDLSGVSFLDSAGISTLVAARQAAADAGHRLRIRGERDNVRRVLEIAGVLDLLR